MLKSNIGGSMNIKIKYEKNNMIFSIYNRSIDNKNINNTNIIDTSSMVFKDDYFITNNELMCSFLNTVVIKKNINTIIIKDIEIVRMVLNVTNIIKNIKNINIVDNKKVPYEASLIMLKSNYLENIECYSMDYFIFDEINTRSNIKIKLRDETLYLNGFMDGNDLNTYSKIFYKKSIIIDYKFNKEDFEYLEMFININNSLNSINLYGFNNIALVFYLINKYKKYNIKINIYQNKLQKMNKLYEYVNKHKKMIDKYKINIKYKYSKEYLSKNILKQINLNFASFIVVIVIIIILLSILY